MVDRMSESSYREWLPTGWGRFKEPIAEFISSYSSMSEKERGKKYKELSKIMSLSVEVIGESMPTSPDGYRGLAKKLEKSQFSEQTAVEDLGAALLFMGYQIVENRGKLNSLYFDAKRNGNLEGLVPLMDYVQRSIDGKETPKGPDLEERAEMPA